MRSLPNKSLRTPNDEERYDVAVPKSLLLLRSSSLVSFTLGRLTDQPMCEQFWFCPLVC